MAVRREHAAAIEVVKKDELPGQGVVVGGNLLAKQQQVRIAVALLDVAKDLIVGAILLDDVHHVLEDGFLAMAMGYRDRNGIVARSAKTGQAVGNAIVLLDLLGVA